MAQRVIRQEFSNEVASTFLKDLQYQRSRYFYYLGGVLPWDGETGADGVTATDLVDTALEIPETEDTNRDYRSEVAFVKRISPNDASLVCRKIEWTTGTVYDQYDDHLDMRELDFYVLTTENQVYKCLNNFAGGASTVQPTGRSIYPFTTSDGYTWKYMYTVSSFMRNRFSSVDYMPVKRALADSFYNNGQLEGAVIVNPGTGYTADALTTVSLAGASIGSGGAGNITGNVATGGVVTAVNITNGGTNYTSVYVHIESVTGEGCILEPVISGGVITDIIVVQGGTNYEDTDAVHFHVGIASGSEIIPIVSSIVSGTGADITTTINAGVVDSITIVDGGENYFAKPTLAFTAAPGGGTTAEGEAVILDGRVVGVFLTEPGDGYLVAPSVTITAVPTGGNIIGVNIVNGGAGFDGAPTLTVEDSRVGPSPAPDGLYAGNVTALLDCVVDEGRIVQVNILDPGIYYSNALSTTITPQGDGSGAILFPVVYNGQIIDVRIDNPGSGYTNVLLNVVGGNDDAELSGTISQSDYTSDQAVVEQTTQTGAIYAIKITQAGNGWTSTNTSVEIIGNGTGATAVPVVVGDEVVRIDMTNYGTGYTWATVKIVDDRPERDEDVIAQGDKALAYAILPPAKGHGVDAPTELFGDTVVINTPLSTEMASVLLEQEYRHYGIIKNMRDLVTGEVYAGQFAFCSYKVTFDSNVGLKEDEILVIGGTVLEGAVVGGNKYRVYDISGDEVTLLPLDSDLVSPVGVFIANDDVGRTYVSSEVLDPLEVDKYSGSLLYISAENPFTFSEEQSITIKTYIKF